MDSNLGPEIVIELEESSAPGEVSADRSHNDHRHDVVITDVTESRTYRILAKDKTPVKRIINRFFEKLETERLPSDELTCDGGEQHNVFELEGMILGEFIDAGHNLRWKFKRVGIVIIVNGRKKTVFKRVLSYEEVVRLAFANPSEDPNVLYKVTYRNGNPDQSEGVLVAGDKVRIKEGMIFVVTPTNQS